MAGRALRSRRRQAGFTLTELLMGIAIATAFAAGLYAFFFSSWDMSFSQQTQARSLADTRTALERFTRDARQAVSPDGGLTGPVGSMDATSVVLYVDPSRSAGATSPRPWKVRYSIVNGQFVREAAAPIGAIPPFTYGAYGAKVLLADKVTNAAGTPPFAGLTEQGVALALPVAQPRDIAQIRIDLLVAQKTGAKATTTELTTDVSLRNPIIY